MKKYFFLLLFVLAAVSARAQFAGAISVTRKTLCQRNGSLYMVLDIRVGNKAVTRTQSLMIIPELSTPDRKSVKVFPHVLINGPYRRHMHERHLALTGNYWVERQPYKLVNVNRNTDEAVRYEMTVPYEPWMANASLVLRQILTEANNSRRIYTVDVNGAVDTE